MLRPQIKPPIFIALQNGMAALLFAALLGAELVRRLLYDYPQSELLWWLTIQSNRTVMPMLGYVNQLLPTPDRLLAGLAAGVIIPLLGWWARYWLVTAVAGHLTLGALLVMAVQIFREGNFPVASLGLVPLMLFVLMMCIADHVAFMRFMALLWTHFRRSRR
jgi:hypothetical protein